MVRINGTEFELYNYQKTAEGVTLTITNTTTAELETAIGDSADVVISDEYRGYGLKTASMYKEYGTETKHVVALKDPSLEEAVQQNAEDTEANAQAIVELAELIAEVIPEESEAE